MTPRGGRGGPAVAGLSGSVTAWGERDILCTLVDVMDSGDKGPRTGGEKPRGRSYSRGQPGQRPSCLVGKDCSVPCRKEAWWFEPSDACEPRRSRGLKSVSQQGKMLDHPLLSGGVGGARVG